MAFKGAGDKEPERRHPGALQDGEGSLQDGRPRRQPQGVDLPLQITLPCSGALFI